MSANSKIEWTDHTFNPWIGCTKVSPGCANCYAETEDKRRGWTPDGWGKGKPRKRTTTLYWNQALKWNRGPKAIWEREGCSKPGCGFPDGRACIGCGLVVTRPRVFPSLCDWLDDEVPIEWLADFLDLIRLTPNLDWLLLSKRPENWSERIHKAFQFDTTGDLDWLSPWLDGEKPPNVWLGVSVEDQDRADKRVLQLLQTPAAVRFLSCEPLLGPINLCGIQSYSASIAFSALEKGVLVPEKVDWVIVGGESGPKARPMHPAWARDLRNQCNVKGVPFFFKQWGEFNPLRCNGGGLDPDHWYPGRDPDKNYDFGDGVHTYRVGKRVAGRSLDGRQWNEMPALTTAAPAACD